MNATRRFDTSKTGASTIAILLSAAIAFVCGAIWAGVLLVTNYEIGYLAIGIGFLTALPFMTMSKQRSSMDGLTAAGFACLALVMAKLFIVQWASIPQFAEEIEADPSWMLEATVLVMEQDGSLTEAQMATLSEENPSDADIAPIIVAVTERHESMTAEEKSQAARDLAEALVDQMTVMQKVQSQASPWDILWIILACVTAWKVAMGEPAAKE